MILADAGLLLHAHDAGSPRHARARAWLEAALSAPEPLGLPWLTVLAFLRLATDSRVFASPLTSDEAMAAVEAWLRDGSAVLVEAGPAHLALLGELVRAGAARGPLVFDAHLAALAREHGAVVCTDDPDFARFEGVAVRRPLREAGEP